MEVYLEWNDVYFNVCIKMGEYILGELNGKTHTNVAVHYSSLTLHTIKGANGK